MVSFLLIIILFSAPSILVCGSRNISQDVDITWGDGRGKILKDGQLLTLSLDNYSGSGFQSKNEYLFGKMDMQIKLVPGNSAGTVTAFYLSSQGPNHDEIDFEFLGNLTGEPYTLHTNVYCQGKGEREQQFHLWFDPTSGFHTFSILWNPKTIVFSVDNTPIREFKNLKKSGVQFTKKQPMKMYSSIWGADWATRGGLTKTDWAQAPFTASFRNFKTNACPVSSHGAPSDQDCHSANHKPWMTRTLDPVKKKKLKWVQKNYMIYNYCTDTKRFPQGLPPECSA